TDYFDPGLSYRLESWQVFQDVYLGLVVKARVSCQTDNCTKILPGLATTIGTVTAGGKGYKFTLRTGLKYSNRQPGRASEFKDTENPPAASNGPYYYANYNPSKSFVLKRNPYWKKGEIAGIPDGNPDKVVATMTDDQAQSAQLVASGQYMYDENILPTDQLQH